MTSSPHETEESKRWNQSTSFTVEVWNASTVRGLAGAPEVLSAAAHRSTRSDLAWTAPANEGLSAISGYRIEWSADGNALDRAGGGHRQHGDYRRFGAAGRLESEIGYGIAMFDGGITGTPNVGFGLSDRARDYRLGWRRLRPCEAVGASRWGLQRKIDKLA